MARTNLINEAHYVYSTYTHYTSIEEWDNALRSITDRGVSLGLIDELEARRLRHLGHI